MKTILITGISSGIGKGLAKFYCDQGIKVYGLARRECNLIHPQLQKFRADITSEQELKKTFNAISKKEKHFDLVILNAGILGEIKELTATKLEELKKIMETNLWGQKNCIDSLLNLFDTKQLVAISSGASVNGNKGWGGYSLSKAALNMLIKVYAKEHPQTHFTALAPGLVDTQMQDCLWEVDSSLFPAVKKLHEARNTKLMPTPEQFALRFDQAIKKIRNLESGNYIDIREMTL